MKPYTDNLTWKDKITLLEQYNTWTDYNKAFLRTWKNGPQSEEEKIKVL